MPPDTVAETDFALPAPAGGHRGAARPPPASALSSPFTWLVFFVIVLALFTVLYWTTRLGRVGDSMRYQSYVSTVEAFGILIALISFMLAIVADQRQQKAARDTEQLALTQAGWVELERYFAQQQPQLRRLYKQMYADNAQLQRLPDPELTPDVREQEVHAASQIFQIIANVYWLVAEHQVGGWQSNQDWIHVFRSWLRSPILREQWRHFRRFYDAETQQFIDAVGRSAAPL